MSEQSCPICGDPAATGKRYCTSCGGSEQRARSRDSGTGQGAPQAGSSGGAKLFVSAFLFIGLVATAAGLAAPEAFPLIRERLGHWDTAPAHAWGEVRYSKRVTNVRAGRGTRTRVVGRLQPGDSVLTDFRRAGWVAVFSTDATVRDEAHATGYVFAELLEETPPQP